MDFVNALWQDLEHSSLEKRKISIESIVFLINERKNERWDT